MLQPAGAAVARRNQRETERVAGEARRGSRRCGGLAVAREAGEHGGQHHLPFDRVRRSRVTTLTRVALGQMAEMVELRYQYLARRKERVEILMTVRAPLERGRDGRHGLGRRSRRRGGGSRDGRGGAVLTTGDGECGRRARIATDTVKRERDTSQPRSCRRQRLVTAVTEGRRILVAQVAGLGVLCGNGRVLRVPVLRVRHLQTVTVHAELAVLRLVAFDADVALVQPKLPVLRQPVGRVRHLQTVTVHAEGLHIVALGATGLLSGSTLTWTMGSAYPGAI